MERNSQVSFSNSAMYDSRAIGYYEDMKANKNNLKVLREAIFLSQEEFAELVGVSVATVSRHETGARDISTKKLREYAQVLGCSPGDIISENLVPRNTTTETNLSNDEQIMLHSLELCRAISQKRRENGAHITKEQEAIFLTNLRRIAIKEIAAYGEIRLTQEAAEGILDNMSPVPSSDLKGYEDVDNTRTLDITLSETLQ